MELSELLQTIDNLLKKKQSSKEELPDIDHKINETIESFNEKYQKLTTSADLTSRKFLEGLTDSVDNPKILEVKNCSPELLMVARKRVNKNSSIFYAVSEAINAALKNNPPTNKR